MRRRIRVVLKSGFDFAFSCEDMKVKTIDNQLVGYSYREARPVNPMYIRMEDVPAVIDEGKCEDGGQDDV